MSKAQRTMMLAVIALWAFFAQVLQNDKPAKKHS